MSRHTHIPVFFDLRGRPAGYQGMHTPSKNTDSVGMTEMGTTIGGISPCKKALTIPIREVRFIRLSATAGPLRPDLMVHGLGE